jgi:hypothetical protein
LVFKDWPAYRLSSMAEPGVRLGKLAGRVSPSKSAAGDYASFVKCHAANLIEDEDDDEYENDALGALGAPLPLYKLRSQTQRFG